jgi:hypothetical protein
MPFKPTSSLCSSSTSSLHSPLNGQETLHGEDPSTTITFQRACEIVSGCQRILQEWNERWGTGANFSYRALNSFLDIGPTKVPADRVEGELADMFRRGREALLKLESIAFVDLQSIQSDEFQNFWIETFRVVEGLSERVTQVDTLLRLRLDTH